MKALLLVLAAASTVLAGFHGTFDGASCYAAPSSVSIDTITSALSYEAWVYPLSGGATRQGLIGTWDDNTGSKRTWYMWLDGLVPVAFTSDSPGGFPQIVSPRAIAVNQWTHIAFAKTAAGVGHIYVDGALVARVSLTVSIVVNDEPLRLGCTLAGGVATYFTGYMDGVRVWNVARDVNEVLASMNTCGTPTGPGLVAQYNFDEGTGTTLGDSSGNGNNATAITGSPGWGIGDSLTCATQNPVLAAYCYNIANQCALINVECTVIRNAGYSGIADDCDTSVTACTAVHEDCEHNIHSCSI